jgi:TonB family protein
VINHLTEDQISRWFIGQSDVAAQRHIQACTACTAELDHFLNALGAFKSAVTARAERLTHRTAPSLAVVVGEPIHAPSMFRPLENADAFRHTRWLSLVLHAVVLLLLVIPVAITSPRPTETIVMLYNKTIPLIFNPLQLEQPNGGGGGGGRKALTPPSKGELPRGTDKQVVPPLVEVKNLSPELVVESTIMAPQLAQIPVVNVQIGDPNGVAGPLSAGPGTGGGIGTGVGTGVGPGTGPGAGPGFGGGMGGGVFSIGGGVSEPRLLSQVQPEYSDDARKARVQGTVELVIVVDANGNVLVDNVRKSLGYGLDQRAIEAVRKWKFAPGKKDGQPVATWVSVLVNFSLR